MRAHEGVDSIACTMRWVLLAYAVAVAIGATTVGLSAPLAAPESFAASTSRVGYERSPRSGRWELWATAVNGTDPRRIVGSVNSHIFSGFTAAMNGRSIAYVRDDAIHVMAPDGTRKRRLAGPFSWSGIALRVTSLPTWSPDRKRLAFAADPGGGQRNAVFIANIDGTDVRPVRGASDHLSVGEPKWSSKGEIAFMKDFGVWGVRPDGSSLRLLTSAEVEGFSWSPDGARLVYHDPRRGVVVLDVNKQQQRVIAERGREPAWNPWGDEIAFTTFAYSGIRAEIWVVRSDGSGLRQLTDDRIPDVRPFWLKR